MGERSRSKWENIELTFERNRQEIFQCIFINPGTDVAYDKWMNSIDF